jgi:hypothetical protein
MIGTVSVSLLPGQPLVLANSSASLVLKGDDLSLQFGTQSFPIEQKLQGSSAVCSATARMCCGRPAMS